MDVVCVAINDVRYTIPKGTLADYILVDHQGKHYQVTDQNLKYKINGKYQVKRKKLKP